MLEKNYITNSKGQKIAVLLEQSENQKGLAFIMHGMGGFKEQSHIKTFADSFTENSFTVVRFDVRNTLGESEGNYENANITNYYEDLEDVLNWAKNQKWYQEPFYLAGHSLGGICILLYAEKHPKKVKGLAPISTAISGELSLAREPKERIEEWNRTGWKISPSTSKPGLMKKLKWHQYVTGVKKYDVLPGAKRLKMPVLLIVGEKDNGTPLEDHKLLFNKLPGQKELHLIKNAPHTFKETRELKEIKELFTNWIKKVENTPLKQA
ncbi:alpha/beta fold hydrolase [Candidatus Woesearchaeota archaeon]|nr:alpha/beta fold hydrolase [Candidatus Woesearchaeota archaeon]